MPDKLIKNLKRSRKIICIEENEPYMENFVKLWE